MTPLTPEEAKICEALNLIKFYPREFHDAVLDDIAAFAGPEKRPERLRWLVKTAGLAMAAGWSNELRGLWCTRFQPADKIEAYSTLPGHTAADIESENLQRQIPEPEQKQLAAGELRPSELPDLAYFANQKKLKREENYEPPEYLKNL